MTFIEKCRFLCLSCLVAVIVLCNDRGRCLSCLLIILTVQGPQADLPLTRDPSARRRIAGVYPVVSLEKGTGVGLLV